MSSLFNPIVIREVELRNRIVVSPMCEYSSEDGFANDWHFVHLGSRAVGGAGLVFTEATAVSPEGRISPFDLGIWKDEHIGFLKRIVTFIKEQGAVPGIQLAHAGRKASKTEPWNGDRFISLEKGGWRTLAPSAIPFSTGDDNPSEMSEEDVNKVIYDFRDAAIRAEKAGFKVIEIHAAHGYLIHEFLSPLSNKRNDHYGGSYDNRIRLLSQIVKEVRQVWKDNLPLFVRISATDWHDEGWKLEDSIELAARLKELDVDLIDCSTGGNVKDVKIPVAPNYQVPFAEAIKKEAQILTGAVGLITNSQQANDILEKGQADLVFLGREFLRDPYFPMRAAAELNVDFPRPKQYERAKPRIKS